MPDDPHQDSKSSDRAVGPAKRPRAGEAFMRAVERDPAARTALGRVQHRLRAIIEAFQSPDFRRELERSRWAQQAAMAQFAEQIRQVLNASGQDLAALELPAPTTLEEWEHLARVVEMPFETVRSGDYTLRDVYVMALAWVDRQAILRMRGPANASQDPDAGAPARVSAEIAGPKPKHRGEWPVTRTQPEVARYVSERQAQYNDLVPRCLAKEPLAKERFRGIFGPTAIAEAIGDGCQKQNVAITETYKKRIKPVLNGKKPLDWQPPEQHDAELDDEISRMHREAGQG